MPIKSVFAPGASAKVRDDRNRSADAQQFAGRVPGLRRIQQRDDLFRLVANHASGRLRVYGVRAAIGQNNNAAFGHRCSDSPPDQL